MSYECAQGSLNKFAPGSKFSDITPDLLRKYEKWMLGEAGNSVTTIQKWGNTPKADKTFIFPEFSKGVTTEWEGS